MMGEIYLERGVFLASQKLQLSSYQPLNLTAPRLGSYKSAVENRVRSVPVGDPHQLVQSNILGPHNWTK
jgi:hypothetical protein